MTHVLDASLGPGTIAILQPACTNVALIELALGIQYGWAERFTELGRPALSLAALIELDGEKRIVADPAKGPLPDALVWPMIRQVAGARWGVVSRITTEGARSSITARLVERREAGVTTLGTWELDGSAAEIGAQTYQILDGVCARLGLRPRRPTWDAAFDTPQPLAITQYLRALGVTSLVDWGLTPTSPTEPLRLALEAAPTMQPARDHLPKQLRVLRDRAGIAPFVLTAAYERARRAVGDAPPEWEGIEQELREAVDVGG
jgi:hypothetical protein